MRHTLRSYPLGSGPDEPVVRRFPMMSDPLKHIAIMDPEVMRVGGMPNVTPHWRLEGRQTAVKILDIDAAEYAEALPSPCETAPAFFEAEVNIAGDDLRCKERVILRLPCTVALNFRDKVLRSRRGTATP